MANLWFAELRGTGGLGLAGGGRADGGPGALGGDPGPGRHLPHTRSSHRVAGLAALVRLPSAANKSVSTAE